MQAAAAAATLVASGTTVIAVPARLVRMLTARPATPAGFARRFITRVPRLPAILVVRTPASVTPDLAPRFTAVRRNV
jgi:hypothetical protein